MDTTQLERSTLPMSRRDLLRLGSLSIGVLAFSNLLEARASGLVKDAPAKSVIQIWLSGGPSHVDTFDPKAEAGEEYCGPFKTPAVTNVPGMRICELLPLLAKQADKYSLIRSMTHPSEAHETAAYIVQTGTLPSEDLVYPSLGAVIALKKGYGKGSKSALPPYITLTSPLGRFSEEGFLGADYKTFVTGGDPSAQSFTVEGLVPPGNVSPKRLQDRRALLGALDTLAAKTDGQAEFKTMNAYQQQAYSLILGEARKAFDLSLEKDDLRKRYGRNSFGQSCLVARRLVESGVPFITINYGGWDTHKDNFPAMHNLLPPLDSGIATLLDDLAQHGLLSSTIVLCCGEFGRTPKVQTDEPWVGGRHHHSSAFSALIAGGGFRGGAIVGASDPHGELVASRPVYPWDLAASIYNLLGIDPMSRLPHPQGCVAYVTPLANGSVPSGGTLKEIM